MFKKKSSPDGDETAPRRKIAVIIAAASLSVLVLAGVGFVAMGGVSGLRATFFPGDGPDAATIAAMTEGEEPAPRSADLVVMPFDAMIVNIAATSTTGQPTSRFMRVALALVYDQTKDADSLVETRHMYMRDAFQDYLRHLTTRDIEGTLGLVTVKSELLRRARTIAGNDAPHEVLILELVVQ